MRKLSDAGRVAWSSVSWSGSQAEQGNNASCSKTALSLSCRGDSFGSKNAESTSLWSNGKLTEVSIADSGVEKNKINIYDEALDNEIKPTEVSNPTNKIQPEDTNTRSEVKLDVYTKLTLDSLQKISQIENLSTETKQGITTMTSKAQQEAMHIPRETQPEAVNMPRETQPEAVNMPTETQFKSVNIPIETQLGAVNIPRETQPEDANNHTNIYPEAMNITTETQPKLEISSIDLQYKNTKI